MDFAKYPSGTELFENLTPLAEGGAERRAGSRYVADVKTHVVKGRLKKFEFSTTQNYVLEMGDQLLRFFRNQGQITVPNTDGAITNGTFDSDISGWTDKSSGTGSIAHDATNNDMDLVSVSGANKGIAEQEVTVTTFVEHVLRFRVLGAPGDSVIVRVGSATGLSDYLADFPAKVGWHCIAFTPAASFFLQFDNQSDKTLSVDDISLIDNLPVEITTPWLEADLYRVEGPQSADILYQFHGAYSTHKLERRGHTTWSMVEVAWQDGPYLDINVETTTMTPTAATGLGIDVTASSVVGINEGRGFLSTDVGRLIRIDNPASGKDWGWAIIVSVTSTTVVVVDIKRDFATANSDANWMLGAWSGTTGYPSVGAFFEQRLWAGNTTKQPQTGWGSQTADFENMTPDSDPDTPGIFDGTVEDNDAIIFTIAADNVNAIHWMSAGENTFAIGTSGGEWVPSSVGAVLTPSDFTIRRQTTHGSTQIQPIRVGNAALFVQKAKRKIREFSFQFESEGFKAFDMTRLAEHITRGGIVEMDYAEERESQVYIVRNDGVLPSMTFRRQEDVVGWARNIIGGSFNNGDSIVESIVSIGGADGAGQVQSSSDRDEVWLLVKRTIDGNTVRYIEFIERSFETGDAQEDAYYADSLITYDSTATTTITGLDHLEGETVKIWADGAIHPPKTVASGQITLDAEASVVQVGLPYTHRIKTLKINAGNPEGTAVGKIKRIYGLTLVLLNSHTAKVGPSSTELTEIDFRQVNDPMDAGAPLFTGERFITFGGDWETDNRIIIESDDPAPFTLLALVPRIKVPIK